MHTAPDSNRFANLQSPTSIRRLLKPDPAAPFMARLRDCIRHANGDEFERIVAGVSLTAGGVLGVLVAGLFR